MEKRRKLLDTYFTQPVVKLMVGKAYQAELPEFTPRNENFEAIPSDDHAELKWKPNILLENVVSEYEYADKGDADFFMCGRVPDDEQALKDLHNVGYIVSYAETRRRMIKLEQNVNDEDFNKQERYFFELGLYKYGRNFRLIKDNYLRHKSVKVLIAYYYKWKGMRQHVKRMEKYKKKDRCYANNSHEEAEY